MSKIGKNNISKLIIEGVLIVFAISMGLIVNELRENYNKNKKTEKLITSVIEEIKQNKLALSELIIGHEAYRDSLKSFIQNEYEQIAQNTGYALIANINVPLNTGPMSLSNWEIAKYSGYLDQIDNEFKLELIKISEIIIVVNSNSKTIYNLTSTLDAFEIEKSEAFVMTIHHLISNLINSEKYLLQQYESILAFGCYSNLSSQEIKRDTTLFKEH